MYIHTKWRIVLFSLVLFAGGGALHAQQTPFYGGPFQLPTVIQAEDYDRGGEGVAWHDTSAGNVFGAYRTDDVDVGAIPTGGYHVGFLGDGEWVEYTVNVPYTQDYEFRLRVASASPTSNTFHVELNGLNVSGTQTVANNGDWQAYSVKTFTAKLTAGNNKILRVAFDTGAWNFDSMDIRGNTTYAGGAVVSLPASRLEVERYDAGGEGIAYHDTTPGNAFGVFRFEDVDVGDVQDGSGSFHIGNVANGEWTEYLVNLTATGSYTLQLRYASANPTASTFHIDLDGVPLSGSQSVTPTGGWLTWTFKTIPVTLNSTGQKVLRITFDTGAWNLDYLELAAQTCSVPSFSQQPTPNLSSTPLAGSPFTITAIVNGATSYEWYRGTAKVANGNGISGATTGVLQIAGVEQGRDKGSYILRAINSCGSKDSDPVAINRVRCGGDPEKSLEDVNRALRGGTEFCDWLEDMFPNFPNNFGGGGSYNRPVIAAAVAFAREPVRSVAVPPSSQTWNMYTWWTTYLQGELGDRGTAWYFGGEEFGSFTYQKFNVASVLAVHYQASRTGQTAIRDLARRWLRANFALQALATVPGPVKTRHSNGTQDSRAPSGYNGPYIAMAGERSPWGHWSDSDRSILFSQAVRRATNFQGEGTAQLHIRKYVEGIEGPVFGGPGGSVYGLTGAEETELWNVVANNIIQANYVTRFLGNNLRTVNRYDFVAWPTVKATLLEHNNHTNNAPTFGVAYFVNPRAAAGQEAHFVYPWLGAFDYSAGNDLHHMDISHGTGRLDVTSPVSRYIEASNDEPPGMTHPPMTVRIDNLPLTARSYWLVLSPTAPPAFQP
ncbi:MAG TPA: carbohydrate-binding protein [Thermoanaerobaculia bacterium]|jgi:hypothetical protein|nr:carbohydrate-binding protein [Thermoanaerobaculia bacterium]